MSSFQDSLCAICYGFTPWSSMAQPMQDLLDQTNRAKAMNLWRTDRLQELTFVGLAAALIAATVTSSLGWKELDLLPTGTAATWYGALLFALLSICTAIQQTVALSRVNSYADCEDRICRFIGVKVPSRGAEPALPGWKVRKRLLLVWSVPMLLLDVSIGLFLVGLATLIFSAAVDHWRDMASRENQIAIAFGVFGVAGLFTYFFHVIYLYSTL